MDKAHSPEVEARDAMKGVSRRKIEQGASGERPARSIDPKPLRSE
jgi:hypothetical protein